MSNHYINSQSEVYLQLRHEGFNGMEELARSLVRGLL